MTANRADLLRRIPMFASCAEGDLESVDAAADERYVAPGDDLAIEGEPGREVYVVVSGVADVRRGGTVVGRVGAGEVVGEMSVVEDRDRFATVTALTPLHVLVLDRFQFESLLRDEGMARRVAATLSSRLRAAIVDDERLPVSRVLATAVC